MTTMTMALLLFGAGCMGLLASPPPSSAFSPMLNLKLKATHWLMLLSGVGLITQKLMPLRNADDLAIQEVVLGPLVTMVGMLGLWLHTAFRTGKKSRWVFEDSMWALGARAGFCLYILVGIWATVHGLTHQPNPFRR